MKPLTFFCVGTLVFFNYFFYKNIGNFNYDVLLDFWDNLNKGKIPPLTQMQKCLRVVGTLIFTSVKKSVNIEYNVCIIWFSHTELRDMFAFVILQW